MGLAEVLVSRSYRCIAQESRTDMPHVRWNMNGAGCTGGRPDSSDKPPRMSLSYARTVVKSFGVVFFRSGGDGGQGGAVAGVVVGLEHVGQALQGGLGQVSAFSVLPLLVALTGRIRSDG